MDGSAISGGELDPQPLDGFVRQFADALADLKPGQVSEVVETQYGYHLIQLIDQKGRMYHARHIVLRPSYTLEELAAPARMLDSIANLIRKDSITFEEAARKFSDDDNSKMNARCAARSSARATRAAQAIRAAFPAAAATDAAARSDTKAHPPHIPNQGGGNR